MFGFTIVKRKELTNLRIKIKELQSEAFKKFLEKIEPEYLKLPKSHICDVCEKKYFITERLFYEFEKEFFDHYIMRNYTKKIYICEDCVKLHKLTSKPKRYKK